MILTKIKRHESLRLLATSLVLLASVVSRADVVVFKNGDRLTGKIESAEGGKLVITTAVAGKVTVEMKNVKTFSSDRPVKLQLKDGTVINQAVEQSSEGTVKTAPGGSLAPQEISLAQVEKINPPPVVWTGTIAVNGLLAEGNTNSEQLGATINAVRRSDDDRITLGAQYVYGQQKVNGITSTTEDNWFILGQYDLFLTKKFYVDATMRIEKDRIQNLDLRLTPGLGAGYQWIEQPDFNISTEAGAAWVYEKFTNQTSPREDFSARLAYHVDKSFDEGKYKIFHDLQYFPSVQNVNNFIILGDVGLHVDLTKKMFSELKVQVDYDSRPASGAKQEDVKYILGVGWTF